MQTQNLYLNVYIRDIQTNEVSDEFLEDLVRFIKKGS